MRQPHKLANIWLIGWCSMIRRSLRYRFQVSMSSKSEQNNWFLKCEDNYYKYPPRDWKGYAIPLSWSKYIKAFRKMCCLYVNTNVVLKVLWSCCKHSWKRICRKWWLWWRISSKTIEKVHTTICFDCKRHWLGKCCNVVGEWTSMRLIYTKAIF